MSVELVRGSEMPGIVKDVNSKVEAEAISSIDAHCSEGEKTDAKAAVQVFVTIRYGNKDN